MVAILQSGQPIVMAGTPVSNRLRTLRKAADLTYTDVQTLTTLANMKGVNPNTVAALENHPERGFRLITIARIAVLAFNKHIRDIMGDNPRMALAYALLEDRARNGWTQDQASEKSGIDPNTIAALEAGKITSGDNILIPLARAYGHEDAYFLYFRQIARDAAQGKTAPTMPHSVEEDTQPAIPTYHRVVEDSPEQVALDAPAFGSANDEDDTPSDQDSFTNNAAGAVAKYLLEHTPAAPVAPAAHTDDNGAVHLPENWGRVYTDALHDATHPIPMPLPPATQAATSGTMTELFALLHRDHACVFMDSAPEDSGIDHMVGWKINIRFATQEGVVTKSVTTHGLGVTPPQSTPAEIAQAYGQACDAAKFEALDLLGY